MWNKVLSTEVINEVIANEKIPECSRRKEMVNSESSVRLNQSETRPKSRIV